MEQIDRISLISEIFWIILVFFVFYFWIIGNFIPSIYTSIKLRMFLKNIYRDRSRCVCKSLFLIIFSFKNLIRDKLKKRWLINHLLLKMSKSRDL